MVKNNLIESFSLQTKNSIELALGKYLLSKVNIPPIIIYKRGGFKTFYYLDGTTDWLHENVPLGCSLSAFQVHTLLLGYYEFVINHKDIGSLSVGLYEESIEKMVKENYVKVKEEICQEKKTTPSTLVIKRTQIL